MRAFSVDVNTLHISIRLLQNLQKVVSMQKFGLWCICIHFVKHLRFDFCKLNTGFPCTVEVERSAYCVITCSDFRVAFYMTLLENMVSYPITGTQRTLYTGTSFLQYFFFFTPCLFQAAQISHTELQFKQAHSFIPLWLTWQSCI